MAFSQKLITTSFSLGQGSFGPSGGNSFTAENLRTVCRIGKWGGASTGTMELAIYGMPLSVMNQLSTVGTQYQFVGQNNVTVSAGDATSMGLVFQGTITAAYVDARGMPEVAFRVSAQAGAQQAATPAQPTTRQGSSDAATVMGNLAQQMGFSFENNSVSKQITNLYLWGDLRTQAKELAEAAGIEWVIDNGTLAIWNPGLSRQSTGGAPLISAQTGMVGYPTFDSAAVIVTTLFDPIIKPGGSIQIQSDLTPACGTWGVNSIDLALDSMVPHGSWFEVIRAVSLQANGGDVR